jgi:hypothetical protein
MGSIFGTKPHGSYLWLVVARCCWNIPSMVRNLNMDQTGQPSESMSISTFVADILKYRTSLSGLRLHKSFVSLPAILKAIQGAWFFQRSSSDELVPSADRASHPSWSAAASCDQHGSPKGNPKLNGKSWQANENIMKAHQIWLLKYIVMLQNMLHHVTIVFIFPVIFHDISIYFSWSPGDIWAFWVLEGIGMSKKH